MDRQAVQNMTRRNRQDMAPAFSPRNPRDFIDPRIPLNQLSEQEPPNRARINDQIGGYFFEKQNKNQDEYSRYVQSLQKNILEDRHLTHSNKQQYQEHAHERDLSTFERVCNPGRLPHEYDVPPMLSFPMSQGVRCKRDDGTSPPESGQPQLDGYNQRPPLSLESQYQMLTDDLMNQQIKGLQEKHDKVAYSLDWSCFQEAQLSDNPMNRQVEHVNDQMRQMSQQMTRSTSAKYK
jgi:hypothetical protein